MISVLEQLKKLQLKRDKANKTLVELKQRQAAISQQENYNPSYRKKPKV